MIKVFRVRRYTNFAGYPTRVHHADIICDSGMSALNYAMSGRVHNWRWIDKFGKAERNYGKFEVLGEIPYEEAVEPAIPRDIGQEVMG